MLDIRQFEKTDKVVIRKGVGYFQGQTGTVVETRDSSAHQKRLLVRFDYAPNLSCWYHDDELLPIEMI